MEPKPLFDVKYWEDAYRFLQKIDEASRLKILENIEGPLCVRPQITEKADRRDLGVPHEICRYPISTVGLLG